tara:strand:- start:658 stop:864 length:207 start_codon:yes stop_codon:yes gene_type:complete
MDIGATTPANQIAWRQVAEQKYQKLMEDLQVEERRQAVENLKTTLYVAKSGRVDIQEGRSASHINYIV